MRPLHFFRLLNYWPSANASQQAYCSICSQGAIPGTNPPTYHHPTANSVDTLSIWWLNSSLNLITGQVNIWQWILLDPQISSYYEGKLHKALEMARASCLGSDFTYEEVKSHVEKVWCACMCACMDHIRHEATSCETQPEQVESVDCRTTRSDLTQPFWVESPFSTWPKRVENIVVYPAVSHKTKGERHVKR